VCFVAVVAAVVVVVVVFVVGNKSGDLRAGEEGWENPLVRVLMNALFLLLSTFTACDPSCGG